MSNHAKTLDKAAKERAKTITQRFLEGTTASSPEEAIQTGQRTLEQWCEALRPRDPPNQEELTTAPAKLEFETEKPPTPNDLAREVDKLEKATAVPYEFDKEEFKAIAQRNVLERRAARQKEV